MTEITVEANALPLHITKLESPERFQVWKREMQHYLIAACLWKWTEVENKDAPTAETPVLANDGSDHLVRTTALPALEEKTSAWVQGNKLACNAIKSRLGTNYTIDFENETSAQKLCDRIDRVCKPAGLITLNDLYRRLITYSLQSCKDAADYARQFKSIYNEILHINPTLRLETNLLIFIFHTGLGKEYQDYVISYTQTHEAIKDDQPSYSLEYAITRFLHTVRHLTSVRDESIFTFAAHSSRRPEAFTGKADLVILPAQVNAVPGPNTCTIQKLVNWGTHCKRPYHTTASRDDLTGKKHPRNKDTKRGKDRNRGPNHSGKMIEKDKHRNKRLRYEFSSDEAWAAFSADSESTVPRWTLTSACSQHIAMAKESFIEYTELLKGDAPAVEGIAGHRVPVGVGKVRLTVVVNGCKKDIVLTNVLQIPDIPLNLISLGQLHRINCPMDFVTNGLIHGIKFGSKGIIAWQQANNLYCLELWEQNNLLSVGPRMLGSLNIIDDSISTLAPGSESSYSDTDTERPNKELSEEAIALWDARMGYIGRQNII